jgi:histidine triad (HIT) family protein
MYNHAPKDYQCPFCLLANGEDNNITTQQDIVYKNNLVTAFVSAKWWGNNPAQIVIIPNKHFENIYDLPSDSGHAIQEAAQKIAIALKKIYKCDGISLFQNNEPAGTQEVFHYHFQVFPRYNDDRLYGNFKNPRWVDQKERLPYVKKLRKYFKEHHA